jgi:3-oxoacyl-[acyl-carrier protein] reductase
MTDTSSKVAIVTGASGGIGAAIAHRLAGDGFTVVVNYAGNAGPAEAVVAKIESARGRAVAAQADIADPAAVARLFDTAEAAFGGIDVVVNNAGVMQVAMIAESDDALFDRQIAINLKGVFNTLREASRRLRAGGRIINISSSVTTLLQPTYGVYAATKAAVEAMTSVLTKELRGRNITVNAIAPRISGYIEARLKDANLSPKKIAEDIGMSVRYLYTLFSGQGMTVSGWVRRRRLLRCRAELDGVDTGASITEIAYRWGLNDSAHFSRLFKASFGMSPTQYRSSRWPGASDE